MNNDASRFFFETIRKYLTDFLPRVRNMSPHTIQATRDSLNLLVDYCQKICEIPLLKIQFNMIGNITFITDFLSWLKNERKCGDTTLNQRLSCIRGLFRYAAFEDVAYVSQYQALQTIPLRKVQKNKTIDFMSEETVKAILNTPDLKTRNGLRDAFYMTLMYDSAARNSEMLFLKVKDITTSKNPYMIVNGKGRKKRIIPLMQKTAEMFEYYLNRSYVDDITLDDYLFYTKRKSNGETTNANGANSA